MRTFVFGVLVACIVVAGAQAGVIGVNFTNGGHLLAATDQPGVFAGANWNNVIGGSGSNVSLNDSTGATTTALLTFSATGAWDGFATPNTANAATNTMYSGGLVGNNLFGEVSITLTNIPYASYIVYMYASADSPNRTTLSISDGVVTYYYNSGGTMNSAATSLLLTTSTNAAIPTSGPAQYQLFSGLSESTFALTTGGSVSDWISNNVFGLEIVETPEPATMLTLALGFGLLALAGWRRPRAA